MRLSSLHHLGNEGEEVSMGFRGHDLKLVKLSFFQAVSKLQGGKKRRE